MTDLIKITSKEQLPEAMTNLATRLGAFWNFDQHPLQVTYEIYRDPRTRSQNGLYWMWMEEMANYYSRRETQFDKDDMHDLMRYQFLGTEDKILGNTTVPAQLVSTTKLKKSEMSEYMNKIEAWNTNNGLHLTIPANNEYAKYREARN